MIFSAKYRQVLSRLHTQLREESYYWKVGYYALVTAGAAHLFFLFLFLFSGYYALALLNVASVWVYWHCIMNLGLPTLESKNDGSIGWFVYAELMVHNIVATYMLGTASGFQYYLYVLAALPFFVATYRLPVYIARLTGALGGAIFIELSEAFRYPKVNVDESWLIWVERMNIVLVCTTVVFLFYLFLNKEKHYHRDLLEQIRANRGG